MVPGAPLEAHEVAHAPRVALADAAEALRGVRARGGGVAGTVPGAAGAALGGRAGGGPAVGDERPAADVRRDEPRLLELAEGLHHGQAGHPEVLRDVRDAREAVPRAQTPFFDRGPHAGVDPAPERLGVGTLEAEAEGHGGEWYAVCATCQSCTLRGHLPLRGHLNLCGQGGSPAGLEKRHFRGSPGVTPSRTSSRRVAARSAQLPHVRRKLPHVRRKLPHVRRELPHVRRGCRTFGARRTFGASCRTFGARDEPWRAGEWVMSDIEGSAGCS